MKIPPYRRNLLFWVLRNAITGLTLGGYIESIPLIGGVISYQARNYVATGFTTGNRTSVAPFGFGDMAAVYDFLKLCNDIITHDNRHWDLNSRLSHPPHKRPAPQTAPTPKTLVLLETCLMNETSTRLYKPIISERGLIIEKIHPPGIPIVSYGFPNAVDQNRAANHLLSRRSVFYPAHLPALVGRGFSTPNSQKNQSF